jgi:hypothetical protein
MHRQLQRLEPVAVLARVEQPLERVVVGERLGRGAEHRANGVGGRLLGPSHVVDQQGHPASEAGIEPGGLGVAVFREAWQARLDDLGLAERSLADAVEEGRIELLHEPHHGLDDRARLRRRVAGAHHAIEPVQHDPAERVHHRREGGDRDHVAGGLDRLLLGLALDLLAPLLRGVRRQVPQLAQDAAGVDLKSSVSRR